PPSGPASTQPRLQRQRTRSRSCSEQNSDTGGAGPASAPPHPRLSAPAPERQNPTMTKSTSERPLVASQALAATRTRRLFSPFAIVSIAIAIALGALGLWPLVAIAFNLIGKGGSPLFDAFAQEDIWRLIGNTLIVVAVSTVIAL